MPWPAAFGRTCGTSDRFYDRRREKSTGWADPAAALAMLRTMRALLTMLCALAIAEPARLEAQAEPPATALVADGLPAECIALEELERQVAAIRGSSAFTTADQAGIRIHLAVERRGGAWTAALTVEDASGAVRGVRELERPGDDCAVLDGPLALVTAMLIDAARTRAALQLPPEPEPDQPPARRRRSSSVAAEPETDWGVTARASFLVTRDLLPGWSMGGALRTELLSPSGWPLVIALTLWPTGGGVPSDGSFGAEMTAFGGAAGTCAPTLVRDRWRLRPCALLELGGVRAAGVGAPNTRESLDMLGSGRATVELEARIAGPLTLAVGVGLLVTIASPTYVFEVGDSRIEVHQPGPLAPWLEVGLGIGTF